MFQRNKSICRFLVGSALGGACIVTNVTMALAAEPNDTPPSNAGTAAAPAGRAGQMIHVDPATGARTAAPANADAAAAVANNPALNTSHQGLVEKPAPGGGVMVDLQGRFRSAAVATVGPDGKPSVNCHSPAAPGERE